VENFFHANSGFHIFVWIHFLIPVQYWSLLIGFLLINEGKDRIPVLISHRNSSLINFLLSVETCLGIHTTHITIAISEPHTWHPINRYSWVWRGRLTCECKVWNLLWRMTRASAKKCTKHVHKFVFVLKQSVTVRWPFIAKFSPPQCFLRNSSTYFD
jgi:hypothetical protein